MTDTSRLFFALWPDDETRQVLAEFSQSLAHMDFKQVPAYNFHVTLVFLGQVNAETVCLLKQAVVGVAAQPFVLNFDSLTYWSRPKILCLTCRQSAQDEFMGARGAIADDCKDAGCTIPWMGEVEQCRERLPRAMQGPIAEAGFLVAALQTAAVSCGLSADSRPYVPHITLARHVRYLPDIKIKPIIWRAEAFCLVESCSEPDGVRYKVLEQWPFIRGLDSNGLVASL